MKLLTATAQTQGQRANDFNWCVEGELVIPVLLVCGRDRDDPDGGCGCGRSFSGLNSHTATTTAMVRELDFTREDAAEAVRSALEQSGFIEAGEDVGAEVEDVLALAAEYPVGTVVERRLDDYRARS